MTDIKIYANIIEDEARKQVDLLSQQKSFSGQKIRIMPDVHAGKGCVIGFTSTIGDYVIPNVVGVDIGCGMLTIELGKQDLDLQKLDNVIRQHIPSGRNVHKSRVCKFEKMQTLKCYRELKDTKRLEKSLGTLGGGNHFIEVGKCSEGKKYLIIHTGSRNLGKQVAEYYQNLAYDLLCGKDKLLEKQEKLISLAYLTGKYKEDYIHDMGICQDYASVNREWIARIILDNIDLSLDNLPHFNTIHNYIDIESNIIRKGAIRANKSEIVLIPLNMRDGCIVGLGKGNLDWNNSAPHGAGRIMSRMKAKANFSMEEYQESTKGIFTTSVCESTLDELPMAYKSMNDIVDVINDTVEIVKIIKPIYNFKASE